MHIFGHVIDCDAWTKILLKYMCELFVIDYNELLDWYISILIIVFT